MLKRTLLLLASLVLLDLFFLLTPQGYSFQYVSAAQKIISTSPGWPTLFRLNVTYPYEAQTNQNFSVILQLWQGKNTTAYVSIIQVWMPSNLTQTLIKNQTLQNAQQTENMVASQIVTINVPKRQTIDISVYYSVKDVTFSIHPAWTTGSNHLASIHVYPQTYDELTSQATNLQKQVSDLQTQQWAFIFLTAYLAITLGIIVPTIQKRRKTISSKESSTQPILIKKYMRALNLSDLAGSCLSTDEHECLP